MLTAPCLLYGNRACSIEHGENEKERPLIRSAKNMEKGYSHFELVTALQESGCAICRFVTKSSHEYLDQLFYESVTDVPIRLQLMKSFGFCNWHTWQVPTLPAICVPDMVRDFRLRPVTEENRKKRPLNLPAAFHYLAGKFLHPS